MIFGLYLWSVSVCLSLIFDLEENITFLFHLNNFGKQESGTHAAIDTTLEETPVASSDVIISDGPAKYQGTWVCTCKSCGNYWEVMDLTSRRTGLLDRCPKCQSSSIEKEKIAF